MERTSARIARKTRLATLFLKFAVGQSVETPPLPGTFVEVSIEGPVHDNVFVLPDSALQDRDSVLVVDGIIVGTLAGAREGLAVEVSDAQASE